MTVDAIKMSELVFAADLGGTHLRVATIDRKGKLYCRRIQPTPQAEKPNEIVHALIEAAHTFQPTTPERGGGITAVSVVVGELWQGAGRGYRTLICVTLGTGVGGGIILDGKLWRGVDGSAAEIGHIGVDPFAGVPCTCGSRGCLEVYASATAIVRMTREARPRYPNSMLHNTEDLTSEKIYQAGIEGDELAIEVFRRMGVYLGIGLASLINVLNPEIVVIGGGLSNGWDLFEQHMHQQVIERAFPIPARRVKIVRALCGDDAGLLGAARLAFKE